MIYVDSSVVLADVLTEARRPEASFWASTVLVGSRLVEYECWVRIRSYGKAESHGAALADRIGRLSLLALDEAICARVRAPFPVPVRMLDALHLAAAEFLAARGFSPQVATYDERLAEGARALGFRLYDLAVPDQPSARR